MNKKERIKIHGKLQSSLRKNSPDVTYSNIMNSGYIDIKEKYKPKFLIFQIILSFILVTLLFYFELFIFVIIFVLNYIVTWIYSFVSILKNNFKNKNNKLFWFTLIFFIPFSAFVYPDFKRIQTIKN